MNTKDNFTKILIGDRVLVDATEVPANNHGMKDDNVGLMCCRVVLVGPGFVNQGASNSDPAETWNTKAQKTAYIPLQVEAGDLVYFMRKDAVGITHRGKSYFVLSQLACLLVIREKD